MYEIDWAQSDIAKMPRGISGNHNSALRREDVECTLFLHWMEHCLECSPPLCYKNCSIYKPRKDKKCARFVYGIYPNPDFGGLFNFGADLTFRRWAKLETKLYGKSISVERQLRLHRKNNVIVKITNLFSGLLEPVNPKRKLNGALTLFREKYFEKVLKTNCHHPVMDEFILEAFSAEDQPFRLIIEYTKKNETKFRHGIDISPGMNFHKIPAEKFCIDFSCPEGYIKIYPDKNAEVRVIFTWLDFLRYKVPYSRKDGETLKDRPFAASKVKCVVWDLDNTLWDGIIAEEQSENIKIRPHALKLIKNLDERGIVQTVASKNDFEKAWKLIEKFELQNYFLYPAINWGSKSSNLSQIARNLNLNVNAFALIDDSPFERAQIQSSLPEVRVYCDKQITELLSYSEFDVPVTEASKQRRNSYLAEMKRGSIKARFDGDYKDFLVSCRMKLRFFEPKNGNEISRCLELIQRSSQLNLSSKRYAAEEFDKLLSTGDMFCVSLQCEDKFGDYGIVCFASINEADGIPVLQDFVLSCRVAQKRVEHSFCKWLAERYLSLGQSVIRAAMVPTQRNKILLQVFEDIGFEIIKEDSGEVLMELVLEKAKRINDVMAMKFEV